MPEDENVPISIASHIPVVLMKSRTGFSRGVKSLTRKVSNRIGYEPEKEMSVRYGGGFFAWLRRLFGRF